MDEVVARLESHQRAFEGLMSLTPADIYYGKDNEDQWKRKKQTKEQKRAAKKAKLHPSANKSALDVYKEGERKRKRELNHDEEPDNGSCADAETTISASKKQKVGSASDHFGHFNSNIGTGVDEVATRQAKAERRRAKREKKAAKKAKTLAKAERKQIQRQQVGASALSGSDLDVTNRNGLPVTIIHEKDGAKVVEDTAMSIGSTEVEHAHFDGIADDEESQSQQSTAPTSVADASVSSEIAQTISETAECLEDVSKPSTRDSQYNQERLRARIDALRNARNADGPDGRPARNRQELIEARRKKEEKQKLHKKELRAQARQEQRLEEAEAEAARLRGGSSSPNIFSPSRATPDVNFSFGHVTFDDGKQLNSTLSDLIDHKPRKGPQDPKTALDAAQRKLDRVNGFDQAKREDIEEKDRWLNAKKRIHGEKIKDDVSLLKKTLKRREKEKNKSGKEWNDRIEGVKKGQEMRQKKREDNIQKRKDEKGNKGKKHAGKLGKKPIKKRPGFEGSFKASHKPRTI